MEIATAFVKRHSQNRTLLAVLAVTLTLLNVLFNADSAAPSSAHGIQSNGITETWEIDNLRNAAMTPEESVHYRLETDAGAAEWATTLPHGRGVVHVDGEPYRLAVFHQLECLAVVREEVLARRADPSVPASGRAHFCLNYLRESIDCHADAHLEMVRSEYGGRAVLPYTTRTDCKDWERVWDEAEGDFHAWARAREDLESEHTVV